MKNIIELLINASESKPDTPLYVDNEKCVTYKEALDIVKSIACYLKNMKINNEPILVPVTRTMMTPLLFLGIAYSGNYYVPISSDTPKERKEDIIHIGEIHYAFNDMDSSLHLLSYEKAKDFPIDEDILNRLQDDFNEENPLYLMFTSGSTGKPKGVLKSHRNMISFVESFEKTIPVEKNQRMCNQTPFYFDASAKDIYLSLKTISTLYIPDSTLFALPTKILQYLVDNHVTMIMWVPSALIMIAKIKVLSFIKPIELKHVFFIGEPFPPKYLNMWIDALPDCSFTNLYGSTETAGAVLYYPLNGKVKEDSMIPVGRPLYNNIIKLDDGEICVSSNQVAIGYIKDEERNQLTFRKEDGQIFLHTGDYGEYDENQNIVFKSRKDYQIKHLGYRIELQDIENTLSSIEYISSCCCLFDAKKDKIILLVVLNSESDVSEANIIKDAKGLLPSYMVPGKVILLYSMPLNRNGKIDRVKLKNIYLEEA